MIFPQVMLYIADRFSWFEIYWMKKVLDLIPSMLEIGHNNVTGKPAPLQTFSHFSL